jgi:hypothetical protein
VELVDLPGMFLTQPKHDFQGFSRMGNFLASFYLDAPKLLLCSFLMLYDYYYKYFVAANALPG